jgi:branched-subunit amino acid ABC-type transport system permease component
MGIRIDRVVASGFALSAALAAIAGDAQAAGAYDAAVGLGPARA